jgi:parallel beta-helix repeat protein
MYIGQGGVYVTGGTCYYNQAGNSGGGIYNNAGTLTIKEEAIVTKNTAQNQGGGLYLATKSTTTFTSCLVTSNTAQTGLGDGVYQQGNANVDIKGLTDDDDPGGKPLMGP